MMDSGVHSGFAAQISTAKCLSSTLAVGRVMHLGVELHAEVLAAHIAHGGIGTVGGAGQRGEPFRHARDAVAVRHPDRGDLVQHGAGEQGLDLGGAVLALGGGVHLPAQGMGERLHAVADAEDRQA